MMSSNSWSPLAGSNGSLVPQARPAPAAETDPARPAPAAEADPGRLATPDAGDAAEPAVATNGDAIDIALGRLDGLQGRPLAEHADAYDALHDALRNVLAELDDA